MIVQYMSSSKTLIRFFFEDDKDRVIDFKDSVSSSNNVLNKRSWKEEKTKKKGKEYKAEGSTVQG